MSFRLSFQVTLTISRPNGQPMLGQIKYAHLSLPNTRQATLFSYSLGAITYFIRFWMWINGILRIGAVTSSRHSGIVLAQCDTANERMVHRVGSPKLTEQGKVAWLWGSSIRQWTSSSASFVVYPVDFLQLVYPVWGRDVCIIPLRLATGSVLFCWFWPVPEICCFSRGGYPIDQSKELFHQRYLIGDTPWAYCGQQ